MMRLAQSIGVTGEPVRESARGRAALAAQVGGDGSGVPRDLAGVDPTVLVGTTDGRMQADVLTVAMALSLWVAFGSVTLAILDGLDEHAVRRVAVGLAIVAFWAVGLVMRAAVTRALRRRPWLVSVIAPALLAVISIDGLVGGPYVAVSLTSVGIAVVVARAGTVWLCVAVLSASYLAGVLVVRSPAELSAEGQLGTVVGALASYPVAAILLLGLRRRFTRFVDHVEPTLDAIRGNDRATTPALERALRDRPAALPAPSASELLTPTERRVVQGLADGHTPKQLAFERGVSINTVRTHISNAKRKTGARTLRELAGMPMRAGWTKDDDEER